MLYTTQLSCLPKKVEKLWRMPLFKQLWTLPPRNTRNSSLLVSSLIASISILSPFTSFAANPVSQAPLYDGQILHIDCNGDVNDKSVVGRSVTNAGVTFFSDRLGNRNRACFFDSMGYLKIAKSPDLNLSNFTISAWVTVDRSSAGNSYAIVSNYSKPANASSGFQHYGINMKDGIAGAFYDDGTSTVMGGVKNTNRSWVIEGTTYYPTPINDSKWHHVAAVVIGGSKSKIYVDGVLQATSGNAIPLSINPTGDLYIGRGGDTEVLENRWQGKMDDVRILNRALSTEEVKNLLAVSDTPTGALFTPLGSGENDPFLIESASVVKVGDQEITMNSGNVPPVVVTPNQDGSVSINTVSSTSVRVGAREGERPLDFNPQTFVLNNGNVTILDETKPTVVATLDNLGNLKVTDTNVPDLQLNLFKGQSRFVFTLISNPNISIEVNHDGSLLIEDKAKPNMFMVRGKDAQYTAVDRATGAITLIDSRGNAIINHKNMQGLAATFNIFDQDRGFTLVDTENNACVKIDANGHLDSNTRFNSMLLGDNGNNVGFLTPVVSEFESWLSNLKLSTGDDNKLTKGIQTLNEGAKIADGLVGNECGCTSSSKSSFSSVLSNIGTGLGLVNTAVDIFSKIVGIFQNKKIKQLEKQIEEQQATIQIQQQQIAQLETTVKNQVQQIAALETKVAEQETIIRDLQAQVVSQQADIQRLNAALAQKDADILALNQRLDGMQQMIDQQAAFIAQQTAELRQRDNVIAQLQETNARLTQQLDALQRRIDDLETRLRAAERGVDEIPEGELPTERRSVRASAECSVLVDSVIEFIQPVVNSQLTQIVLHWATDTEINIAGFNVKRSTEQNANDDLVNPTLLNGSLIPSKSSSPGAGARYEFTDNTAVEGVTYYYQIESVDTKKGEETPYKAYTLTGKLKPLLAKFTDISVNFVMGQATFAWQTLSERGSMAFNLWMAKPEGSCQDYGAYTNITKLNERPIPATGASNTGKSYLREVAGAISGYCYGVEEIDVTGASTFYIIGDGIEGIMAVN